MRAIVLVFRSPTIAPFWQAIAALIRLNPAIRLTALWSKNLESTHYSQSIWLLRIFFDNLTKSLLHHLQLWQANQQ
ncbi:hypothetical protein ACN4EK_10370 [Pantanalinema rosaneae CENA516]|uniref:hypothetical protein n=1 Tax=Pantanalinema rosaneae TaxID=1620701 RepID=UPI003D6FB0E0